MTSARESKIKQREMRNFIIFILLITALAVLSGCSMLTAEQQTQIKDAAKEQVNKPENQEKVIKQINEVLK